MSLASTAQLLLAASDLKLVQLLRHAIRVADLTGAAEHGRDRACGEDEIRRGTDDCNPSNAQPAAVRPLKVIDRYEPTCPCVAGSTRLDAKRPIREVTVEVVVEKQRDPMESPIQPPWKVLPWENPPQTLPAIKVVRRRPDIVCKGTVLDCFI